MVSKQGRGKGWEEGKGKNNIYIWTEMVKKLNGMENSKRWKEEGGETKGKERHKTEGDIVQREEGRES